MARVARTARRQTEQLIDHYLEEDRREAAQRLTEALSEAVRRIDRKPALVRRYPANYVGLAAHDMSWIKVHRYWFGYREVVDGESVIANVLWDEANMPSRIEPFDDAP